MRPKRKPDEGFVRCETAWIARVTPVERSERIGTWVNKVSRYWPSLITIAASLASIVGLLIVFFEAYTATFLSIYIVAIATVIGAYVPFQEYRYARRSAYAEALRSLHGAVHILRDSMSTVENDSFQVYKRNIQDALNLFATSFSIVTRTNCRATVKTLGRDPQTTIDDGGLPARQWSRYLLVRTLARDSGSVSNVDETADYIDVNDSFVWKFNDDSQSCFFENNLVRRTREGRYRNSHFPEEFNVLRDRWPLPYRSTIVWPIQSLTGSTVHHPSYGFLGYLTVDSPKINVFLKQLDFEMGALVADAMYMYMKAFYDNNPNV